MNTSYGVILFKIEDEKKKILMINRKDSLCYIDFIRGKYNINDYNYINKLFSRMSNKEIDNIKNKSFEELWKNLWNIKYDVHKKKEYKISEKKINKIKKNYNFPVSKYENSEWEFPKGKKNSNEPNKIAACRELEEETNIKKNDYKIINNIIPISETINAENNINYKNIYYLGLCLNDSNIFINDKNIDQVNEIKNVKFLERDEAISLIRDYNISKINIINNIFNLIENLNFEIK
tara:strand:- start:6285 stop:6989 length:705 start_codon:yes stop_codon:yes gene_type:complete